MPHWIQTSDQLPSMKKRKLSSGTVYSDPVLFSDGGKEYKGECEQQHPDMDVTWWVGNKRIENVIKWAETKS
jgi:hypothetical protein